MTSAEFAEWMAYYQIEPFGEAVADERHGIATALLVNMNRDPKSKPAKPEDFIPWRGAGPAAEDDEPVMLDDDVAQSNLIRAAMFGLPPKGDVA